MTRTINLGALLSDCADDSFDDGIRIDTELEPLSGPGGPVKPAVYEGGVYQQDPPPRGGGCCRAGTAASRSSGRRSAPTSPPSRARPWGRTLDRLTEGNYILDWLRTRPSGFST